MSASQDVVRNGRNGRNGSELVRNRFGTSSNRPILRTGQFSGPQVIAEHSTKKKRNDSEGFGTIRKCQHMSNIPTLVRKGQPFFLVLFFVFCFVCVGRV